MTESTPTRRLNWTGEELLLAAELVYENDWRPLDDSDDRVQSLSLLLRLAAVGLYPAYDTSFRSPSSVALKTRNIATQHPAWNGSPSNGSKGDLVALRRFMANPSEAKAEAETIRMRIALSEKLPDVDLIVGPLDSNDISAKEGESKLIQHFRRERDPALRAKKIRSILVSGKTLACEVCHFDFQATYGPRGAGYIEIHHVTPLHVSGPTTTRLEDLVALCSNCHRMVHRGPWLSPEMLASLIVAK